MNLDLVIAQLKQFAPVFEGRVAGAASFAAGLEGEAMLDLPAAYVVPMDDEAGENSEQNGLFQDVTERIGVIVELDNDADRRGQAAAAQYDDVRRAIWRAVLGWNPDPEHAARALRYGGGRLLEMDRARLFYQWDFLLDIQIGDEDGFRVEGVPLRAIYANPDRGDPPVPARVVLPQ